MDNLNVIDRFTADLRHLYRFRLRSAGAGHRLPDDGPDRDRHHARRAVLGALPRTAPCCPPLIRKVLYVGAFAFILNNFANLADIIFESFAGLGLQATGSPISAADLMRPGFVARPAMTPPRRCFEEASRPDRSDRLLRELRHHRRADACLGRRAARLLHPVDPALHHHPRVQADDACRLRARAVRALEQVGLPRRARSRQCHRRRHQADGARRHRRHRLDALRRVRVLVFRRRHHARSRPPRPFSARSRSSCSASSGPASPRAWSPARRNWAQGPLPARPPALPLAAPPPAARSIGAGRALGAGAGWRDARRSFLAGGATASYQMAAAASDATGAAGVAAGVAGVARAGASVRRAGRPQSRLAGHLRTSAKPIRDGERGAFAATGGTQSATAELANYRLHADRAPDWARRMRRHQRLHEGVTVAAHTLRDGDRPGLRRNPKLKD